MTPSTALLTPLPPYRLSPSRSSTASKAPVEAPEGTAARPSDPSSKMTSTSTVGLPRESRISRAPMNSILATVSAFPMPPRLTRRPIQGIEMLRSAYRRPDPGVLDPAGASLLLQAVGPGVHGVHADDACPRDGYPEDARFGVGRRNRSDRHTYAKRDDAQDELPGATRFLVLGG